MTAAEKRFFVLNSVFEGECVQISKSLGTFSFESKGEVH